MNKNLFQELAQLFKKPQSSQEMKMLLQDILTPTEIEQIIERLQIIKMLAKGEPQRTIKKKLKVSIDMITRGSHALQKTHGGFPIYIKHFVHNAHG